MNRIDFFARRLIHEDQKICFASNDLSIFAFGSNKCDMFLFINFSGTIETGSINLQAEFLPRDARSIFSGQIDSPTIAISPHLLPDYLVNINEILQALSPFSKESEKLPKKDETSIEKQLMLKGMKIMCLSSSGDKTELVFETLSIDDNNQMSSLLVPWFKMNSLIGGKSVILCYILGYYKKQI